MTIEEASNDLEQLLTVGKQIVIDLRANKPLPGPATYRQSAYARVYYLRREITRIVRALGADVPPCMALIEREYEELKGN